MRLLVWGRLRLCLAIGALGVLPARVFAQVVQPIDLGTLQDASQFEFLAPVLKGVEIVSLGESVHLTSEIPRIRVGIIRYLSERAGFQMLGMEGSAADIWVAQDGLLNSSRGEADISQALRGFFPIWNTNDVRELLAYEAHTWSTSRPLYVTAYDIQPGTSKGAPGKEVFHQLIERLRRYAAPPINLDESGVAADLAPLTAACKNYVRDDSARVERGIAAIAAWADEAAPAVEARFGPIPHAAVLQLIPANLRASHRLCRGRLGEGWSRYKSVRDTNAAPYAVALKAAAPNGKLILWAHLSHLSHNSEGSGVSVGEILHREFGPRVYTIMPFAEAGIVPLIYNDVDDDLAYARVHGGRGPLGTRLSRLSKNDYFLDLRSSAPESLFTTPQAIAVEASTMSVTLARDFDGIVWLKRVHPPSFTDPRMTYLLVGLSLAHYRIGILIAAVVLVGCSAVGAVARHRRRRAESYTLLANERRG